MTKINEILSCWVVSLKWTSGCEADAESTEIKAVFMCEKDANDYCKILKNKINWFHYYQGCLDVEEVPFQPKD